MTSEEEEEEKEKNIRFAEGTKPGDEGGKGESKGGPSRTEKDGHKERRSSIKAVAHTIIELEGVLGHGAASAFHFSSKFADDVRHTGVRKQVSLVKCNIRILLLLLTNVLRPLCSYT